VLSTREANKSKLDQYENVDKLKARFYVRYLQKKKDPTTEEPNTPTSSIPENVQNVDGRLCQTQHQDILACCDFSLPAIKNDKQSIIYHSPKS
jgi:hypothetical protein